MPPKQQKPMSFTMLSRLLKALSKEFTLQSLFKYGYRNKEDISNLPPETLVIGSQNVLTNAAELVTIRQGYTLDGPAGNQNNYGIDSSYDFQISNGSVQNLRKWGPNLEVRYVNPVTNVVSWINFLANLNVTKPVNFTNYWDGTTELSMMCLFVNGGTNVYEWSGGVASFSSASTSQAGVITAYTAIPIDGGLYYSLGDILYLAGGTGGQLLVTGTGAQGTITDTILMASGSGYTETTVATATNSQSGGTGATIAISTVATGATLTISGSSTIQGLGFYTASADSSLFSFVVDGVNYTYTGAYGNTFFGVSPAISGASVGDAIIQNVNIIQGSSITDLPNTPSPFVFDLISYLDTQVWYGSLTNTTVYVSESGNWLSIAQNTPRVPGDGAIVPLDAPPTALIAQEDTMYISAGRDEWWISQTLQETVSNTSDGTTQSAVTETLGAVRLKTAHNQGSQSQGLTALYKNSVVYVSNEQIINAFGLVKDIYAEPQVTNLSDPIKYDIDAYNFTGGQVYYDNYYIYVCIPKNDVVRMYNVVKQYWEAPQTIPISRIYHVTSVLGSALYGHSYLTNESYELFTGYADNNNPINSVLAFPYVSSVGGTPWQKKSFNKIYTEGYISSNASLMLTVNYDFGAYGGTYTTLIAGQQGPTIFNRITDGSIGQNSLGSEPIGNILNIPASSQYPKFRIINTMPRVDCYEYQLVYSSDEPDYQWSILRCGPAVSASNNLANEITI